MRGASVDVREHLRRHVLTFTKEGDDIARWLARSLHRSDRELEYRERHGEIAGMQSGSPLHEADVQAAAAGASCHLQLLPEPADAKKRSHESAG